MRPIDADALIKDIAESIRLADEWEKEAYETKDEIGMKYAVDTRRSLIAMISRVKEALTIELKQRHGWWIQQESPNGRHYNCSECGHEVCVPCSEMIDPRDYDCYLDNYCGKCGAKMFQSGDFITKERLAEIMTDGTHGDCWFFDTMEGGANE